MLSIRNLVKVYPGPVAALQGINLDLQNGMFGLLGPNGAGKTTFMRVVAGLLEPTSGEVLLDGTDVIKTPQFLRSRLGYLPQDFGLYPHLTGEKMLAHLLRLKGVESPKGTMALARELLDKVNLSFASQRKVKTYSGGMRQRLGLAQAIAGDPRLIIVDEPTAGLDPEERVRFYYLLAELAEKRIVLLSTHIVEDVAVLCSRFAMINRGRIVAQTSPSEVRKHLEGNIYEASVSTAELESIRKSQMVTQAILVEGTNRVRIYQKGGTPPIGFIGVPPTLQDAYFVTLRSELPGITQQ